MPQDVKQYTQRTERRVVESSQVSFVVSVEQILMSVVERVNPKSQVFSWWRICFMSCLNIEWITIVTVGVK